jgi:hypothetical protein
MVNIWGYFDLSNDSNSFLKWPINLSKFVFETPGSVVEAMRRGLGFLCISLQSGIICSE